MVPPESRFAVKVPPDHVDEDFTFSSYAPFATYWTVAEMDCCAPASPKSIPGAMVPQSTVTDESPDISPYQFMSAFVVS